MRCCRCSSGWLVRHSAENPEVSYRTSPFAILTALVCHLEAFVNAAHYAAQTKLLASFESPPSASEDLVGSIMASATVKEVSKPARPRG